MTVWPLPLPSRAPVKRQTLSVHGRKLDVLTVGDPTDAPLVFLHGFGANPHIYLRSLAALSQRERYIIAPALPSFGRSTPLPVRQQTVAGVAAHIAAFLDEHFPDLGPVDFVGHSFGGGISLRIAATRPDLVKSLTLVCPVGGAGQGATSAASVVWGVMRGDAGDKWLRNGVHHFMPAFVRHAPSIVAAGLSAWFSDQLDDVKKVESLNMPTRFVFAKHDQLVRPGQITAHASNNVHVEVQHGRHSWLIDESERFVELVIGDPTTRPAAADVA